MLCPYCFQPVRPQARFCNSCGKALVAAEAPVATAPATPAPLPGKATPTGPMNPLAAPSTGALQELPPPAPVSAPPVLPFAPDLLSPLEPAPIQESAPAAHPDHLELAAPPDVPADEAASLAASGGIEEEQAEPEEFDKLYATQEALAPSKQEAIYSFDEEAPTVQAPQPARNEADITPELLASLGDQTPLAPGMVLEGRYRVEEVIHTSEEENLYRVSDQRGYLHCWACGTDYPNNHEGERFCSNCGADMLGRDYWLREQRITAAEGTAQAASPSAGLLEASKAGAPGANGAHPVDFAAPDQDAEDEEPDPPTQPTTAIASFIIGPRHYRVEAIEVEDPIFPLGVTLAAGARSDVGVTRQGNPNEDSILLLNFSRIHESITQPFGLFIVADGLGGHDDGQTASRRAIGEIASYLTREVLVPALRSGQFAGSEVLGANLKAAIEAANLALVGSNEQTGSDMGSTVTGAMIVGDTAYVINVGDSRTYLYDTTSLQPISIDHSLVMQLVIGGLIERDDIYTHPQRNQILRSLGDRRDVQVDLFIQKLRPGHQLVVCCDGLWEMIRDPQIEQIIRENSDPQAAADLLMKTANDNGGEDNISVIVVQARE